MQENQQLRLKTKHPYYDQIQGQLYICHKACLDLIVWTTKSCEVIRIAQDPSWAHNIEKLEDFYFTSYYDLFLK